jgi:Fe2+ or Zn2+ uptake regulation protein
MATQELCIDSLPHNFVFKEKYTREISWHHWKHIDIFFCTKCLKYEEIEQEPREERRW